MKINFEIVFTDEDDRYFHSDAPMGYVNYELAKMWNTTLEDAKKKFSIYSSFEFIFQENARTTIRELLDKLIEEMKLDNEKFYACNALVHIHAENEIAQITNYDILLSRVFELLNNKDEFKLLFVYSVLQGEVWREGKIRYHMYSHEEGKHNKPHIHVFADNRYSVSIDILNGKVLDGYLPSKYMKVVKNKIIKNKEFLISCWNKMTDGILVDINYGLQAVDFK